MTLWGIKSPGTAPDPARSVAEAAAQVGRELCRDVAQHLAERGHGRGAGRDRGGPRCKHGSSAATFRCMTTAEHKALLRDIVDHLSRGDARSLGDAMADHSRSGIAVPGDLMTL